MEMFSFSSYDFLYASKFLYFLHASCMTSVCFKISIFFAYIGDLKKPLIYRAGLDEVLQFKPTTWLAFNLKSRFKSLNRMIVDGGLRA